MSETKNAARFLNPWVFNLQKLALELKCPLCLNLLCKPMLLPCNHIFCNVCIPKSHEFSTECPACQHHFADQDVRPASHMENIVAIYKSLDATFKSTLLPLFSNDSGSPNSISSSVDQLRKKLSETAPKGRHKHDDDLLRNSAQCGIELTKCPVSEELDVNHSPESPGSSPSSANAKDVKVFESDRGTQYGGTENHSVKRSVGDNLGAAAGGVDTKDTFHTREPKRQKKLNYGLAEPILQSHGCSHQTVSQTDQAAVLDCNKESKIKEETACISSMAPCDATYANENVCAFCHSSKITEATGQMLHYADGKEVALGESSFSKAIPVHSKCIEWTPQVYYVGVTIKNLESELVRASKLKCSSCGLKGAALGCFAKSCRRTYHVPCAVEIPDCRWDCDDFVMLCPIHKSIKFPREKSNSKKRHNGEKCSLSSQIVPKQLDFWATSPGGSREWFFCGSALSSEEKCLMVKFATICGATACKFWNPRVTHVIAATDANGAYSRTLKVLMAILDGKWILTMDWVKACVEANCHVSEERFEVNLDNHGCRDGPRTGRLRASNNAPKLFDGLSFHFHGAFIPAYKSDLLDLVRVGGGTIIEAIEQLASQRHNTEAIISSAFIVYNHDFPQGCVAKEASALVSKRSEEAKNVAKDIDARVIPHTWILESIAAARLLPFPLC
ncbi:hypothetical protein BUALT_Bualt02G0201400 [Buddleja alternifolia]|uniref:RING-type E3 ubiquitin transferase BRCA1 n=1 Tax=Buddleja alternifolia TaxID=168488 RepID=A0AAV6Y7V3_9LAMI|nr:hypothetical protein BUALT_Bualt02G0201400 [Buddleja alternifolia]